MEFPQFRAKSARLAFLFAIVAQTACGGGGGGGGAAGGGGGTTNSDTTAPTASVTPSNGTTITPADSIVIQFSESMSRASVSIGGTGASGVVKTWSTTTETDDTLTLTGTWLDGDSNTITVDGSDLASNAMTQVTKTYHILGDGVVYVATTGNDSNSGAHDAPKLTIDAAITTRDDLSFEEIRVATGTYTVSNLALTDTLKGGYDSTDWTATRDLTQNATVINNSSTANGTGSAPNATLILNYDTVVDGFTIHGASSANYSAGIFMDGKSGLTVSHCFIDGGAGANVSAGIWIGTSYGNCTFSNNTITGGTGADAQYGFRIDYSETSDIISSSTITVTGGVGHSASIAIYLIVANGATIFGNTLTGGAGTLSAGVYQFQVGFAGYRGFLVGNTIHGGTGTTCYGARIYKDSISGTTTIQENTIYGGNGTTTTGVSVNAVDENRPYVITRNKIHGGNATGTAIGISHDIAAATITNNAIFGGVANITRGLAVLQGTSPYFPHVYNNTINGGNATTTSSALYASFDMSNIANNIFLTSGGASRYALDYWVQGGSIDNNAFIDGSTVLLHTRWNCGTACIDYNTLNDLHTQLGGSDVDYIDSIDAIDFTNATDPNATWSTTNYSLANTSSANIKTGGLDGVVEGWGFTVDLIGTTRTGSSGFGWSIGAYEN